MTTVISDCVVYINSDWIRKYNLMNFCHIFRCGQGGCGLFTGSIVSSAKRQYLIYSEADFEVFGPVGATRCDDGGQIWRGGGDLARQISPHQCNDKGIGPPKLKFLRRFDHNVEYKRPAGAYPLCDFHKICRV